MSESRQTLLLDAGWLFYLGDIDAPLSNRHIAAYMANKAGWARGAAKPSFDDSDWRDIRLPHDWSIEGEYSKNNHINAGFLPRGVGWYRRHFALDESSRGKSIWLRFDGISSHATIYVNGHLLHRSRCGYTPAIVDISDVATFGEDALNVIAVRVDATQPEGWWYEGAGIYRHVWLTIAPPVHVEEFGVFVNPTLVNAADDRWSVIVETEIRNRGDVETRCIVASVIETSAGIVVARSQSEEIVPPRSSRIARSEIHVDRPMRWSLEHRHLYRLRSTLIPSPLYPGERVRVRGSSTSAVHEKPLTPTLSPAHRGEGAGDELVTNFGFRTIRFDANDGFFLNDQPVKLKGTCNHQDHAGVGVAVPDAIHEFRIRRLLEMGSNAFRAAHNPPATELLDACDRLGMLVMDENRNFGSSPEHVEQLKLMIKRDRNHPSVILWALCNEEAIQATRVGENIARSLAAEVCALDSSRPVTAAVSGGVLNLEDCIPNALDVMGINYQIGTYDKFHRLRPTMPLIAAETHCVLSTRGTYETVGEYFDSFDEQKAPWGETARKTWRAVRDRPFVAGLFAWTGFDYRGEPTPKEWPSVTSHWGILDLCGFEKDAFYLHKAFWTDSPFIHLTPAPRVMAMTNCEEVELFVDGESIGRKHADPIDLVEWRVERGGVMHAVGFRGGNVVAETTTEIVGPAVSLALEIHPSAAKTQAKGRQAFPITALVVDADGRRVHDLSAFVKFSIDGPARIIGFGNGDPVCHEPDNGSSRSLFGGLAQVIVETTGTGRVELSATADNLRSATLALDADVDSKHEVPIKPVRRFINDWRVSPVMPERPIDPTRELDAQDMNSWERFDPRQSRKSFSTSGVVIYRAQLTIPRAIQSRGGQIAIDGLPTDAEIYVDQGRVEVRREGSRIMIELKVGNVSKRSLTILHRVEAGSIGVSGIVELLTR